MGLLEQRSERVRHGSSRDRQVQVLAQSFSRCDWRYSYGKGRLFRFSWFYL
jgi:regulator of sirC expression with transglutaminase-like and TPR domain